MLQCWASLSPGSGKLYGERSCARSFTILLSIREFVVRRQVDRQKKGKEEEEGVEVQGPQQRRLSVC